LIRWAREKVNPRVWNSLSFQEKFMVLEADNEAMDLLQACRQLSRLLLTERYELLLDPAYQVRLTYEPIYRRVLEHCMSELRDSGRLGRLNRQVTRMMLELEDLVREPERAARTTWTLRRLRAKLAGAQGGDPLARSPLAAAPQGRPPKSPRTQITLLTAPANSA